MKNHILSTNELDDFESRTRLAGQHGHGINKSLDMFVRPTKKRIWFVVESQRKEIAAVPDLSEAIEIYNNL